MVLRWGASGIVPHPRVSRLSPRILTNHTRAISTIVLSKCRQNNSIPFALPAVFEREGPRDESRKGRDAARTNCDTNRSSRRLVRGFPWLDPGRFRFFSGRDVPYGNRGLI